MKKLILTGLLLSALSASAVNAQPMPPGPPPPHGGGIPSAEMLATIPELTAAQQADVRRILTQRRDAAEASENKLHAEFDALRKRERDERERLDTQTSDQLRKALGDDGYRRYALWNVIHEGPMGGGGHGPRPPHGEHGPGSRGDDDGPKPPAPHDGGAGKPDDE